MEKIDAYIIDQNLRTDPSKLTEAVERRLNDSAFRADLLDLLSNLLNESIRKINTTANIKYLTVVSTDQYVDSLEEVVSFASDLYAELYALNQFSIAILAKIKEIETDNINGEAER